MKKVSVTEKHIEQELERRIDETASLVNDNGANYLDNLKIRTYPCRAEPMQILSDPNRVERGGVQFLLTFSRDESFNNSHSALINVRIAPRRGSSDPDIDQTGSGSFISIYAVDPEGVEDSIMWYDITDNNLYQELTTLEWYRRCLNAALQHRRASKLFGYKFPG